MYNTHDYARQATSDSTFVFLGRRDNLIKVRGMTVEIGEIEAVLTSHPAVSLASVLARNRDGSEDSLNVQLHAYYTCVPNIQAPSIRDIKDYLTQRLPPHMVPNEFMRIEEMPLTTNGKTDRTRLPVIESNAPEGEECSQPRNDIERMVKTAWEEIFDKDVKFGVDTDFFSLGGNSLRATQLASRLSKLLGYHVPIRQLFEHKTIAAQAVLLTSCDDASPTELTRPIPITLKTKSLRQSSGQNRLWFLYQYESAEQHSYNIPLVMQLRGSLNCWAFGTCANIIIQQQSSMRTVLTQDTAGQGEQFAVSMTECYISHYPRIIGACTLQKQVHFKCNRPFRIDAAPGLRNSLFVHGEAGEAVYTAATVMHHVITDGWSMGIMAKLMQKLYNVHVSCPDAKFWSPPNLPVHYADYAEWQNSETFGNLVQHELEYWKKVLQCLETSQLRIDRPRPLFMNRRGKMERVWLPQSLLPKLNELASHAGATKFISLLSVFALVVQKFSDGQKDLTIGSPIANRTKADVEKVIGFFVNTLVFRITIKEEATIAEYLNDVKQIALEAYKNQHIPFEHLVEHLKAQRDTSRSALFQTMFVLQNASEHEAPQFHGNKTRIETPDMMVSRFDWTWTVTEYKHGTELTVHYSPNLFYRATVLSAVECFVDFLGRIATFDVSVTISDVVLSIRDDQTKNAVEIHEHWTGDIPENGAVTETFQKQCQRASSVPCVNEIVSTESFWSIRSRINAVSAELQQRLLQQTGNSLSSDKGVALKMMKSKNMFVALMSVLKSGSFYVPIDRKFPEERVNYITQCSSCSLVICDDDEESDRSLTFGKLMVRGMTLVSFAYQKRMKTLNNDKDLAYMIFTSGTTGLPKGVALNHYTIANLGAAMTKLPYFLNTSSQIFQCANYVFDASVADIFIAPMFGCALYFVQNMLEPLEELVNSESTHAYVPIPLVNSYDDAQLLTFANSLDIFHFGGAQIRPVTMQKLLKYGLRVLQRYGPTEASVFQTMKVLKLGDRHNNIGYPMQNIRGRVLTSRKTVCETRSSGTLHLGGLCLARGYQRRSDLTNSAFTDDHVASKEQRLKYKETKLYDTGDQCTFQPDGVILYSGRKDTQIKIRGFRVEIDEIEHQISAVDGIKQAVVIAKQDDEKECYLIAYYLLRDGAMITSEQIRQKIQRTLPDYMIPSIFSQIEKVPLLPSGKIDRKVLASWVAKTAIEATLMWRPMSDTEKRVAKLWQIALPTSSFLPTSDFFKCGGHSLKTIQLAQLLRAEFSCRSITVAQLFQHTTIESQASIFGGLTATDTFSPTEPQKRKNIKNPEDFSVPLSASQQRMWFVCTFGNLSARISYNVPYVLNLGKYVRIDQTEMHSSFNAIVLRQTALRTQFHPTLDKATATASALSGTECFMQLKHRYLLSNREQLNLQEDAGKTDFRVDMGNCPVYIRTAINMKGDLVLDFRAHHMITDGLSMQLMFQQWNKMLSGTLKQPVDRKRAIDYYDYTEWARHIEVAREKQKYWQDKVEKIENLQLPCDKTRPNVQDFTGKVITHKMRGKLLDNIRSLGKQEGVTTFMIATAALALLLNRYSGKSSIAIGTPVANRECAGLKELFGAFINTVVLVIQIDSQTDVKSFLQSVRETLLETYKYADVPFETILDLNQKERHTDSTPMFQVMLVYNGIQSDQLENDCFGCESVEAIETAIYGKFDLSFHLYDTGDCLVLRLVYLSSLFHGSTALQIVQDYTKLLCSICNVCNVVKPCSELMSTTDVQRRCIVGRTGSVTDYPAHHSLISMFHEQTSKTLTNIVESFKEVPRSYAVSMRNVSSMSRIVQQRYAAHTGMSLRADTPIALCTGRHANMLTGILTILAAGGTYVPLDPEQPEHRRSFVLRETSNRLLIDNAQRPYHPLTHRCSTASMPDNFGVLGLSCAPPKSINVSADLAYFIYTSGTTGKPKGTCIQQRSVWNMASAATKMLNMKPSDRVYQFTNYVFDNSVVEIFMALSNGARLRMVENKIEQLEAHRVIEHDRITHMLLFPSLVNSFKNEDLLQLENLRYWVVGGESPNSLVLNKCIKMGIQPVQDYGPTETTGFATYKHMRLGDRNVFIGHPIENARAVAKLEAGNHVIPRNVPFELLIAGEGISRGYFARSELSAERFPLNPFRDREDAIKNIAMHMYKSGDIVKLRHDGGLEFVGRKDFQIKICGFRVEMEEITESIKNIDEVAQCIVVPVKRDGVDVAVQLAAFYECGEQPLSSNELRKKLLKLLPHYMIPQYLILLPHLPQTPNNKIDRGALPAFDEIIANQVVGELNLPRTPMESIVERAFAQVLGKNKCNITDNFFHIGGHSLSAVQAMSRIEKCLNRSLGVRLLFENQTVSELAAELEKTSSIQNQDTKPLVGLRSIDKRVEEMSLGFGQEQMWFLYQHRDAESYFYNLPFAEEFDEYLNQDVFHESIQKIAMHQSSFRTVFRCNEQTGLPYQQVLSGTETYCCLIPEHFPPRTISREMQRDYHGHLSIDVSPPVRYRFFLCYPPKSYVSLVIVHHIVSDAWSTGLMGRELTRVYASKYSDKPNQTLMPLAIHYVDYAQWQRQYFGDEVISKHISYWKTKLADPPILELPTDKPRPLVSSGLGGKVQCLISGELAKSLHAVAASHGYTMYMIFASAWMALLQMYTGSSEILTGSPVANRAFEQVENVAGYFLNNIMLLSNFSELTTVKELLDNVRTDALTAYEHQELPFELLVKQLNFGRQLDNQALFRNYFNYRYDLEVESHFQMMHAKKSRIAVAETSFFDLECSVDEIANDALKIYICYSRDLFFRETIIRLSHQLKEFLTEFCKASNFSRPLKQISLLKEKERKIVSYNFNKSFYDERSEFESRTLTDVFDRQFVRTSESTSIWQLHQQIISYNQLKYEKDALHCAIEQAYIRQTGQTVVCDCPIGMSFEKNPSLVSSMLGILSAGCGYVPIAPSYPVERKLFLIENSGIKLYLTDGDCVRNSNSDIPKSVCCLPYQTALAAGGKMLMRSIMKNRKLRNHGFDFVSLMYTSGTTGRPKAVCYRHDRIVTYMAAAFHAFMPIKANSFVYQFCSFVFDGTVIEIFGPLITGATIAMPENSLLTVEALLEFNVPFDYLFMPPSFLQVEESRLQQLVSQVAYLDIGAEGIQQSVLDKLYENGVTVSFGYGPSETTVTDTSRRMKVGDNNTNIGRPMKCSTVYILNTWRYPQPISVPGEMFIAGQSNTRGYMRATEEQTKKFAENPFSSKEEVLKGINCIYYQTGDYARWLPDGNILFVARKDTMIKLRGQRVELSEIENVLLAEPRLSKTNVLAVPDNSGKPSYLVAFYELRNKTTKTNEQRLRSDLIKKVRDKLPSYMVPSFFLCIDRIPTTVTGKVDKHALLDHFHKSRVAVVGHEVEEKKDSTARAVQEIWRAVLNLKISIGNKQNFFDIGGDSLLTIQLRTKLNTSFGCNIKISDLFLYQTIDDQSQLIRNLIEPESAESVVANVVVPLQRNVQSKSALVFMHPLVGGAQFPYVPLKRELQLRDVDVVGVQHPNTFEMADSDAEHASIEQLVASYNAAIGPQLRGKKIVFVGSSLGGILCHEAVRQMLADRCNPMSNRPVIIMLDSGLRKVHVSREHHEQQMRTILDAFAAGSGNEELLDELSERVIDNSWNLLQSADQFHPKMLPTEAQVFLLRTEFANKQDGTTERHDLNWQKYCASGVQVDTVPGAHTHMLHQRYCTPMAVKIQAILNELTGL